MRQRHETQKTLYVVQSEPELIDPADLSYRVCSLGYITPESWLHKPVCVGEIHAQQDALLFVSKGGDDNQIPDSD